MLIDDSEMDKRFEEFGEYVAGKRGWQWALAGFAAEAWGTPEEELTKKISWKDNRFMTGI